MSTLPINDGLARKKGLNLVGGEARSLGSWSSGYDIALTWRRSPVRIRSSPLHSLGQSSTEPIAAARDEPLSRLPHEFDPKWAIPIGVSAYRGDDEHRAAEVCLIEDLDGAWQESE